MWHGLYVLLIVTLLLLLLPLAMSSAGFTNWLDSQDPSVRIMAQVAANAPPVPTVACKRSYYTSGRDSSSSPKSSGSNGGSSRPKGSPSGSGVSVGLPPLSMAAGPAGAGAVTGPMGASSAVMDAGVFSSAVNMNYQLPANRPTKVARLTARSSSAPLTFAAAGSNGASGGSSGGLGGSSGNEALLLGMTGCRAGSGALLEGLTSRPVARQLLPNGPNAAAVEAAARQAAVAAAAAAFSGAGTSAAAAAARDALGAAGLAPIRTGNGSPVYSTITQTQRQQQQAAAGVAAAEPQEQEVNKPVSAFAAAAAAGSSGSGAGGYKLLTAQVTSSAPCHASPKAPGLAGSTYGPLATSMSLPEPFLPGTEVPGSIGVLGAGMPAGFDGVGGLLDMGFDSMGATEGDLGSGSAPWGSVGDIAGLLGVSDSHSPMHPGLDGLDAFFGDGSLSPTPQMMF
jgi:hypothetical protein